MQTMGRLLNYQRVQQSSMLSGSPPPPRGTMGAASQAPVFYDTNGNAITAIVCGGTYTLDVPGYDGQQIWLTITKNGGKDYDGLFAIPMAPYTSICGQDEGTYQLIAYDPVSGMVLGQTTFAVMPQGSTVPTTNIGGMLANLTTTEKLVLAGVAAFFLFGGL